MERHLKILKTMELGTKTLQVLNPQIKRMTLWKIDPLKYFNTDKAYFGFDPGTTNLGIAFRTGYMINLIQVEIQRDKNAVIRMDNLGFVLSYLRVHMEELPANTSVVIEGASFGDNFRQAELAECRATITCWMKGHRISDIHIVPPATIRKAVFGLGRTKAHQFWTDLEIPIPNDALAALSCLYYADYLEKEK